jgi:hypothetical protein
MAAISWLQRVREALLSPAAELAFEYLAWRDEHGLNPTRQQAKQLDQMDFEARALGGWPKMPGRATADDVGEEDL